MAWKEGADERIAQFVVEQLEDAAVPMSYVLVLEFMDSDGERVLANNCMPDQRGATTLGLLEFAKAIEIDRIRQEWNA